MKFWGLEVQTTKASKEDLQAIDVGSMIDRDAQNIIHQNPTAMGGNDTLPWNSYALPQDEINLIKQYRALSQSSEVDEALQQIYNEAFIFDVLNERAFDIDFYDDCDLSEAVKKKITQEVIELYNITEFADNGTKYFSNWYVDGRLTFQKIIDSNKPKNGIRRTLLIDPLHLRKVRMVAAADKKTGTYDLNDQVTFWLHCKSFTTDFGSLGDYNVIDPSTNITGLRISEESITYATSGITDMNTGKTISFLQKAIVPFNNLKMLEQAMIIFRVARAPMRRVFYVDVSSMQKGRGEEYMRNMMKQFKTKMVYNSQTGTFNDQQVFASMLEDYWLPRMSEGKSTEIQNLEGQSSQDIMDEVNYMKDKLQRSLNVPSSRYVAGAAFVYGKSTEIPRDEYLFKKFVDRLRERFMMTYDDMLQTQLILKKIITPDEWDEVKSSYFWKYAEDNAFVEFKEAEIIDNRLNQLQMVSNYTGANAMGGRFFSEKWVMKNILRMSDEEIEEMKAEIEEEKSNEQDQYGDQDQGDGSDDQGDDSQDDGSDDQQDNSQLIDAMNNHSDALNNHADALSYHADSQDQDQDDQSTQK